MKTKLQRSYGLHLSCVSVTTTTTARLPFDLHCVQREEETLAVVKDVPIKAWMQTTYLPLECGHSGYTASPMAPNERTPMASGCSGPQK